MSTIIPPTIPSGWQCYPLEQIRDVAAAKAAEGKFAPAEAPVWVWLHPDVFEQVRKRGIEGHVARQQAGCKGCGDPGVD